jgi:hypothetical protein
MEAINGGSLLLRKKKATGVISNATSEDSSGSGEGYEEVESEVVKLTGSDMQGIDLTVVLPIQNPSVAQSGVMALLEEDSLNDVGGFIASRDDPVGKVHEAEKLLQIQQNLGLSFDPNVLIPVDKVVLMEDRDRSELAKWQESNGPQ